MIRVTNKDFQKLVKFLAKEGQDGAMLSFSVSHTSLIIKTVDRANKDMTIELSDTDYPFMPRITKTETF